MSIDFGTLVTQPLRILIMLVGFLLIKAAVLWLIGRPLKVPGSQRRWFAALLGQGSEFAFVVFGTAQRRACSARMGQSADADGGAFHGFHADSAGAVNPS